MTTQAPRVETRDVRVVLSPRGSFISRPALDPALRLGRRAGGATDETRTRKASHTTPITKSRARTSIPSERPETALIGSDTELPSATQRHLGLTGLVRRWMWVIVGKKVSAGGGCIGGVAGWDAGPAIGNGAPQVVRTPEQRDLEIWVGDLIDGDYLGWSRRRECRQSPDEFVASRQQRRRLHPLPALASGQRRPA